MSIRTIDWVAIVAVIGVAFWLVVLQVKVNNLGTGDITMALRIAKDEIRIAKNLAQDDLSNRLKYAVVRVSSAVQEIEASSKPDLEPTKVKFTTTHIDTLNEFSDSKLTVKSKGNYLISIIAYCDDVSRARVFIYKNQKDFVNAIEHSSGEGTVHVTMTTLAELRQKDTIEILMDHRGKNSKAKCKVTSLSIVKIL